MRIQFDHLPDTTQVPMIQFPRSAQEPGAEGVDAEKKAGDELQSAAKFTCSSLGYVDLTKSGAKSLLLMVGRTHACSGPRGKTYLAGRSHAEDPVDANCAPCLVQSYFVPTSLRRVMKN